MQRFLKVVCVDPAPLLSARPFDQSNDSCITPTKCAEVSIYALQEKQVAPPGKDALRYTGDAYATTRIA